MTASPSVGSFVRIRGRRWPAHARPPSIEWLPASDDQIRVHLVSCSVIAPLAGWYNRNVVLIIDW